MIFKGMACPVKGSIWMLPEKLHPTFYTAPREARSNMKPAIERALRKDLTFQIPKNYARGAVSYFHYA
jgi:hypothetical protein